MKSNFCSGGVAFGALALILSVAPAHAQSGGFGVGIATVAHFPAGDFEDVAGFGYGGYGGVELAGEGLGITLRSGYLKHVENRNQTVSFVPIFGGVKFTTPNREAYLVGEMGPVFTNIDSDGLLPRNVNETNLGWGVGVGSEAGPFDLRLVFNVWDTAHQSDTMTLGLTIGFTAWSH